MHDDPSRSHDGAFPSPSTSEDRTGVSIADSADVAADAVIGAGSTVQRDAQIGAGARLGRDCTVGRGAGRDTFHVAEHTTLSKRGDTCRSCE